MPEDLWDAAARLAREHGLWFVSRTLRVSYESLKQRARREPRPQTSESGFVEISPVALPNPDSGAAVIELSSPGGARLTVRLEGRGTLDVEALATAFWEQHR